MRVWSSNDTWVMFTAKSIMNSKKKKKKNEASKQSLYLRF